MKAPAPSLPILIDCDEVLADFVGAVLQLARGRGITASRADVTEWDIGKAIGWPGFASAVTYHVDAGLCGRLHEVPGAIGWLRRVECEFGAERVFICTSPWNAAWAGQRSQWLVDRGVPTSRQIQMAEKHLLPGHLIDDAAHHINGDPAKGRPPRPDGQGFLVAAPWNSDGGRHPRGSLEDALVWLRKVAA